MSVIQGAKFFFDGFSLALRPDMRSFVLTPALISLVIIVTGLAFGFSYVTDLSNYLISGLPSWLEFLEWILEPLLYLMGLLIGAWLFGLLAIVIGSPFLGELSMRVENLVVESGPWWKSIWPALARELRKLRYHLPRLVLLLILSIVPLLNTFAPLFWLGFGAWMMAVQFCDYPFENRQAAFADTLALLGKHRGLAFGFGVCATVGMSIPLLNFVVAPVAVCGGTLLINSIRDTQQ